VVQCMQSDTAKCHYLQGKSHCDSVDNYGFYGVSSLLWVHAISNNYGQGIRLRLA
ncbi:hypothetical protein ARMGADRAFT_1021577, partial [Armillaria gallica]